MLTIRDHLPPEQVLPLYAHTDTAFHVRDAHAMLVRCLRPSDKRHAFALPPVADETWTFFARERRPIMPFLQHHLSSHLDDFLYISGPAMLTPMSRSDDDADDKQQSTAPLWLTALPSSSSTSLSDRAVRAAIRHRYELPCRDDLPDHCACGVVLATEPFHFHVCPQLRRTGMTKRHDTIVYHLADVCRRLAIPCNIEPPMRNAAGKRTRPDLSFVTHDGTVYIDGSVVCPFAISTRALRDSVLTRERRKNTKYLASAVTRGCHFLPSAVSSLGELGACARQVIDLIAGEHHHRHLRPHACHPPHYRRVRAAAGRQRHGGHGGRGCARRSALICCHPPRACCAPRPPASLVHAHAAAAAVVAFVVSFVRCCRRCRAVDVSLCCRPCRGRRRLQVRGWLASLATSLCCLLRSRLTLPPLCLLCTCLHEALLRCCR